MATDSEVTIRTRGKRIIVDNSAGSIYGFAFLGAAVYYIQQAATFWAGVLGILKAIFWPGVLMYKVMELLKM